MWHYTINGETIGPTQESVLRQMLSSGQLAPGTYIWRQGMPQWAPAIQCGLVSQIAMHPTSSSSGDNTGGLIPYKNPNALTGYYVGVGALIPIFGLLLGPAAPRSF